MAIEAQTAYNLFKSGVGGSLEIPLFSSKRWRMNEWNFVPPELRAHWATATSTIRVDGEALWIAFKALVDADTWNPSVLSLGDGKTLTLPVFDDLSTSIQAALNAVAVETA